jgi:hypothetical protein
MTLKIALSAAFALALFAGVSAGPAHAACEAGAKVDGSTAEAATKKLQAAEFRQIRDLKKGCDSFWHATATKNGIASKVSLSPQGVVTVEGN